MAACRREEEQGREEKSESIVTDIDIDFADRERLLSRLPHRIAKLENGKKHNTGVYFTEIPHNPIDRISTVDYKTADDRGYFKLDCLNVGIYEGVRDEEHLVSLMREPIWDLLQHQEFVDQLFHVSGYTDLLRKLKPTNVEQLAAVLAIIRPAKRHLENKSWNEILREVWVRPTDGSYYFKKAHSFSYAFAVIVHMNLLCDELTSASKPTEPTSF